MNFLISKFGSFLATATSSTTFFHFPRTITNHDVGFFLLALDERLPAGHVFLITYFYARVLPDLDLILLHFAQNAFR